MPAIPRLIRQQGIPGTTGVSPLTFDPTQDFITPAMENVTGVFQKIGDDLFKAESEAALSTANTNAALKLNALETELAAGDPATAFGTYESRVREIQQESNAALGSTSPLVQQAFSKKFMELATNSAIKIRGTATKGRYKELEAALITELDTLEKTAGTGGASAQLIVDGVDKIETAVRNNIIDPDAGAKLIIKFKQNVSENIVAGFISRQPVGQLMVAFKQMDTGDFTDPLVEDAWENLEAPKRATFKRQAVEVLSRSLAFEDKQKSRDNAALDENAKSGMLEFYNPKTSADRRSQILGILSKNKQMPPGIYNTMLKDLESRTNRFDDQDKETALRLKILKTPHLVTSAEIINSGLSNVNELLTQHNTRLDSRMRRAKDIVVSAPVFKPGNFAEAKLKGDVFDKAQTDIWNQVLVEQQEANDAGKAYDPVARVKDLVSAFERGEGQDAVAAEAKAGLANLGITSAESLERWIAAALAGDAPPSAAEVSKIRRWGRLTF